MLEDIAESTLDQVAQTIGFDATMRIVAAWGGTTLYVPANMNADHPIARDIGISAAMNLSEVFANEVLDVPKLDYSHLGRNRMIRQMAQSGVSIRLIGQFMNLSKRQVERVLAGESA